MCLQDAVPRKSNSNAVLYREVSLPSPMQPLPETAADTPALSTRVRAQPPSCSQQFTRRYMCIENSANNSIFKYCSSMSKAHHLNSHHFSYTHERFLKLGHASAWVFQHAPDVVAVHSLSYGCSVKARFD